MPDKRYATVKRVSLAGLSEQWDEECFAYVVPANYEDNRKTIQLNVEKLSQEAQIKFQLEFVRSHFISGKIKTFDGETFTLSDMTHDDTASSVAVSDRLYAEIMGFDLDPKDMRKEALERALQKTDDTPMKSSLSTESPKE